MAWPPTSAGRGRAQHVHLDQQVPDAWGSEDGAPRTGQKRAPETGRAPDTGRERPYGPETRRGQKVLHDDDHVIRVPTKILGQGVLEGEPETGLGQGAYEDKPYAYSSSPITARPTPSKDAQIGL